MPAHCSSHPHIASASPIHLILACPSSVPAAPQGFRRSGRVVLMLFMLALASCAAPLSYADVQATVVITGCWPDSYPTPRSVTVTPNSDPTLSTTTTSLPTTTPYPRCPPPPGATAIPWPTAVPPRPPFATMEARQWAGGSWRQTTLHLPEKVLTLDLAAHPTEGWPAVASVVWSGDGDPDRVFVSVYNPRVNQWSHARQVDLGDSGIGNYVRTVAVTITGAGEVIAVWGMSDPDFRDNDPPSGIWTASSFDFGESWSAPQWIATDCRMVNDVAASLDGIVVVQLVCDAGPGAATPAMVLRQADGSWLSPERLNAPVWGYSEGAVVISGRGETARIVALVLAGIPGAPTAFLISRLLIGGAWQVAARPIAIPGIPDLSTRMWHVRGLAYDRVLSDGSIEPAVTFSWTGADAASGVYALTSLDGGVSWGNVEPIVHFGDTGLRALNVAPAYDVAADRLIAVFTCCADPAWTWVETTHYARWSVPGSGVWRAPGGEDPAQLVPLAIGSRAAADTVSAQASGSRMAWLAWIDTIQRIEVRSLDLNQIIPVDAYPTPTPLPAPTTATAGGA